MDKALHLFDWFVRSVLGVIPGAFVGASIGLVGAAIYFFCIYLVFHKVDFAQSGVGALLQTGTQIGAMTGATLFAIWFARRR